MDIRVKYEIVIHLEKNQEIKFTHFGHGVYYFDVAKSIPMETPKYKITDNETIDKFKRSVTGYSFVSIISSNK